MTPSFNKFVTFELSEDEQRVGETFNELQHAVLQNRRAEVAQNILNLEIKDGNVEQFKADRIFLDGQLKVLDWMFAMSREAQRVESEKSPIPQQSSNS